MIHMTLKPLALSLLAAMSLAACVAPSSKDVQPQSAMVFTEPDVTPPFYALNPFNYDAPPPFESHLQKAAAQPVTKMVVSRADHPERSLTLDENKLIVPLTNSAQRNLRYAALAVKMKLTSLLLTISYNWLKTKHVTIHHVLLTVKNVVVLKAN